ncbi:HK97 gp10 family phage protein [Gorillibacterium sp. sgz5001074]|uniref:HK97 gp10 family phage protein n=1 Tax=Gorillibacterium sp. sgz5001074 TaxID=3446695 RepID=UPI003F68151B
MSSFGRFDLEEWRGLEKRMGQVVRAYPSFAEGCIKELAARLLAKIKARTPADSGNLRDGWKLGRLVRTSEGIQVEIRHSMVKNEDSSEDGEDQRQQILKISMEELNRELPGIMDKKFEHFLKQGLRW